MHDRIYAIYANFEDAASAIQELVGTHGYPSEHISVITRDDDGRFSSYVDADNIETVDAGDGAAFGAISGLLIGGAMAAFPPVGALFAVGPLAGALVGAATGAATGGFTAALLEAGADEDDVAEYERVLREGGALVVVDATTDEWEEKIEDVLAAHNAIDVEDVD